MAKTSTEYRDDLLNRLNGDARLSEARAAYFTKYELPYAQDGEPKNTLEEKIAAEVELAEYLRTVIALVEDVDA